MDQFAVADAGFPLGGGASPSGRGDHPMDSQTHTCEWHFIGMENNNVYINLESKILKL